MNIEKMKEEVLFWTKQSYSEHLFAGTSGNLSVFDRETGIMVITPTSIPYETITAADMVAMKTDGTVIDGIHRPSSEWQLHAAVYENMPDAGAVVHTHSPYATGFAVTHQRIPCALIEMAMFLGGDVPLAAFALPGTPEVGTEAVKAMQDRYGCLLANHGTAAYGKDLAEAHIRAVYIEDAAKIGTHAAAHGEILEVDEESIRKMRR